MTSVELSAFLSGKIQQYTQRSKPALTLVGQLSYISNIYKLLQQLHESIKSREEALLEEQKDFHQRVFPRILNEFMRRQTALSPNLGDLFGQPARPQSVPPLRTNFQTFSSLASSARGSAH